MLDLLNYDLNQQTNSFKYVYKSDHVDLYNDLWLHIFSYLKVKELLIVEKVCKRWFQLASIARRNCLCLSLYGAGQNEENTHQCENKSHNCNSSEKYFFGNLTDLFEIILPRYQLVHTLHLNMTDLRLKNQKILLNNVANNFDKLIHLRIQLDSDCIQIYRQLIKLKFSCSKNLQHLIICHTINYEAGNLAYLNTKQISFEKLMSEYRECKNLDNDFAHYKIPIKFKSLKTFHSDCINLQLPNLDQINTEDSLHHLKRFRMDKCSLEKDELTSFHKLFPNLEHISFCKLNIEQLLLITLLYKNTLQSIRLNDLEPEDLCDFLNNLCSMQKLRIVKLMCTRLKLDTKLLQTISNLQHSCPSLKRFVLNKLNVHFNVLEEFVAYWRTFDAINTILRRPCDLQHIDLNKMELCWPSIDLKYFFSAIRHIRTLYFVTDSSIFRNMKCLFEKLSKLRTLHFNYGRENAKHLLANLIANSPKLRVLKLNEVRISHKFIADLPKACPFLTSLELNPLEYMHHPCKYSFLELSKLKFLSHLCLSKIKIHDKELSIIVQNCHHLIKLHITSSRGLNGQTLHALKTKAAKNQNVKFYLNVDSLKDSKYHKFALTKNFLTVIDNYSFSKINFSAFENLIIFTPSEKIGTLNVMEWPHPLLTFGDFKKLTYHFSNMKYYYIKRTENNESFWTELNNEDNDVIPSHNGKILLEFYDSENFIF